MMIFIVIGATLDFRSVQGEIVSIFSVEAHAPPAGNHVLTLTREQDDRQLRSPWLDSIGLRLRLVQSTSCNSIYRAGMPPLQNFVRTVALA